MIKTSISAIERHGVGGLVCRLRGEGKSCSQIAQLCNDQFAQQGIDTRLSMNQVWAYLRNHTTPETVANRDVIESGIQRMVTDVYDTTRNLLDRCNRLLDVQEKRADPLNSRHVEAIVAIMKELRSANQQMMDTVKLVQPQIQMFNQRVITIAETIATDGSLPVDVRRRLIGSITDRIVPVEGEVR